MPNYRNTSAIGQDLGSSYMAIIPHNSDFLMTAGTSSFLPVIETSETSNAVSNTTKENEDGGVTTFDGATTITKKITIMQRDLNSLRMTRILAGQTLAWCKEMSRVPDSNGNFLYEVGVNAKISGNFTITGKSGSIPLEFPVTKNDQEVAVDLSKFADSKFMGNLTGTVSIAAGYGFDHFLVSGRS